MLTAGRRRLAPLWGVAWIACALAACSDAARPPAAARTGAEAFPAGRPTATSERTPAPAAGRPPLGPSPGPTATADGATACDDPAGCYDAASLAGEFDAGALAEVSGAAASMRTSGVLYLLDDGPGTTAVHAVALDGRLIATLAVAGLEGVDTEGLAVAGCGADLGDGAGSCVYVGDIGDNLTAREDIAVYRFSEPDLDREAPQTPLPADVVRLRYPDGPADAEALLVADGVPYLVTKAASAQDGAGRARLYAAPGFSDGELIDLGPVAVPEPAVGLARSVVGNVVTAADSRPGRVVLRTYDHVVEYVAPDPGAPLAEFARWPARAVSSARQPQGEAIAYLADGCGYALASEASGEIWTVRCR